MNIQAAILIYGGGEGSGCNPEAGKCGRPFKGQTFDTLKKAKKALDALNNPDQKQSKWRKYNPNRVAGFFREGTTIADMYKTLVAKEGEWHPISDFEQRHAGKANINYRVTELKYTGKRSGMWSLERSGDQVRIFINKKGDIQQPQQTDEQLSIADKTAKEYIALQKKYSTTSVPIELSKPLFNNYFKSMGVSTESRNSMEQAVKMWTGSVHTTEAQALRKVAMDFYNRKSSDEWTNGYSNSTDSQKVIDMAEKMSPAVMALKAYTSAYARAHDVNMVYRGVNGDYAKKIINGILSAESVSVNINSLSSWSSNPSKAANFGSGIQMKMKIDSDNVWAAKAATPWLFSAHSSEDEYIVGSKKPKEILTKKDIKIPGYTS